MSLYNLLFGTDPGAKTLLTLLNLSPEKAGRVRDVYVDKDEKGKYVIVLFTRNGGGNRYCWGFEGCQDEKHNPACMVSIINNLRAHPLYIRDYDVPEDSTYASFEFMPPAGKTELVEHLYSKSDKKKPMEKFNELIAKMEKGDLSDPEVVKALSIGKNLLDKVTEYVKPAEIVEKEKPPKRKRKQT